MPGGCRVNSIRVQVDVGSRSIGTIDRIHREVRNGVDLARGDPAANCRIDLRARGVEAGRGAWRPGDADDVVAGGLAARVIDAQSLDLIEQRLRARAREAVPADERREDVAAGAREVPEGPYAIDDSSPRLRVGKLVADDGEVEKAANPDVERYAVRI
jgi:hypothetical protein